MVRFIHERYQKRTITVKLANEGLLAMNICGLQGKLNVVPTVYAHSEATTVEAIEAKINKFTRRWLGVPPGLINVAM